LLRVNLWITAFFGSTQISNGSMVSGIPEQTVERRGSLVFCVSKNSETSPHSGRRGGLGPAWRDRGGDASPTNMGRS